MHFGYYSFKYDYGGLQCVHVAIRFIQWSNLMADAVTMSDGSSCDATLLQRDGWNTPLWKVELMD